MSFRIFFTPGKPVYFFRDEPETLAKYVERAGGIDCYHTLNVWEKPDKQTPCRYDWGFDFDSKDIRESSRDAFVLVEWLVGMDCPYRIYFSGSKGIHVVVPHQAPQLQPRIDGGHVCKLVQRNLKETLNLKTLDTEIHGVSRQWRVPNTINSKSGLYKVSLTIEMLDGLIEHGIDAAREIATQPSPDPTVSLDPCPRLNELLQPFIELADEENRKREELNKKRCETVLTSVPICMQQIMNNPAKVVRQAKTWGKNVPTRNHLTFIVSTFLKTHAGVSKEQALQVLGPEWQKKVAQIASSSPLEIQRSTETCLNTVYHGNYTFSCGKAISSGCDCHPRCPLYIPFTPKGKE